MFKQASSRLLPSLSSSNLKRDALSPNLPVPSSIITSPPKSSNEVVVKDMSNLPPGTLQWINKHRPKYCGKVIPVHDAPKIALQLRALLADVDHEEGFNQDLQELKAVVDMVTERFVGDRSLGDTTDNSKMLEALFDSIDKDHSGIQDFAEYLVSNTSEETNLNRVEVNKKAHRLYRAFLELTNNLRRRKAQLTLSNPSASALTKYASFKKLFSINHFAKDENEDENAKQVNSRRVKNNADGVSRRKKERERSKEAVHALYDKECSVRSTRSGTSITSRLYGAPRTSKRVLALDETPSHSVRHGVVKLPMIATARMD